MLKIYIRRTLNRLNIQQEAPKNKVVKDFYINNKLNQITFMKQNPFKSSQWARYAQEGRTVVQIIETVKNGHKTWRYLGVEVDGQLYWYDSEEPFRLRINPKNYNKASHDIIR